MIDEESKTILKKKFEKLEKPVKILFYKGGTCEYCKEIEEMLKEIAELSDKIEYEVREGDKYYITFEGHENIQYWGAPFGHEFRALIDTIEMVSKGVSLPLGIAKDLAQIKDIEIYTFVTPQCPYCPIAVIMMNKFAVFNKNIKSITVEAIEYQEFSNKHNVMAVPKIVIYRGENILDEWEGAYPENLVIQRLSKFKEG